MFSSAKNKKSADPDLWVLILHILILRILGVVDLDLADLRILTFPIHKYLKKEEKNIETDLEWQIQQIAQDNIFSLHIDISDQILKKIEIK